MIRFEFIVWMLPGPLSFSSPFSLFRSIDMELVFIAFNSKQVENIVNNIKHVAMFCFMAILNSITVYKKESRQQYKDLVNWF